MVQPLSKPVRIFIASPGDVAAERNAARRVIDRLKRRYRESLEVEAVLYEWRPVAVGEHVQFQLPDPGACDIAVVVLWSRLGLENVHLVGPLSGATVSGTEWEFEAALKEQRASAARGDSPVKPVICVWRGRAPVKTPVGDPASRAAFDREQKEVERFFAAWFPQSASGRDAMWDYASYDSADEFEARLADHLDELLKRQRAGATPRWTGGNPWRGLHSFEPEHAPLFFGRERQSRELRAKLAAQLEKRQPIVTVLGGSGVGKSSLVKAGLIPDLVAGHALGRIALCRYAIVRPSDLATKSPRDPFAALAAAIAAALDWKEARATGFAKLLAEQPALAAAEVQIELRAQAKKAGLPADARAGFALVIDQLEELFRVGWDKPLRRRFAAALVALARASVAAGLPDDAPPILIVATLRSDFFDSLDDLPEFADLCRDDGLVPLRVPDDAALREIIEQPARMAGVSFEARAPEGLLSERLFAAVRSAGEALPLLSFVLEQLWERREQGAEGTALLHHATYDELGGLEGAIARRAEQVRATLGAAVSDGCLVRVLLSVTGISNAPTADIAERSIGRIARVAEFSADSAERRLIDALAHPDVRLLTISDDGDHVRVAHEALLRKWPFAQQSIVTHLRMLLVRDRVEEMHRAWEEAVEAERGVRLLDGPWLRDAIDLVATPGISISKPLEEWVAASRKAAIEREARALRRTRWVSAIFALLALIATGFGWYAMRTVPRAVPRVSS